MKRREADEDSEENRYFVNVYSFVELVTNKSNWKSTLDTTMA